MHVCEHTHSPHAVGQWEEGNRYLRGQIQMGHRREALKTSEDPKVAKCMGCGRGRDGGILEVKEMRISLL